MRLNKIQLKDKKDFSKYLQMCQHELSTYTFENIYIWKGLFDIYWTLMQDSLCVFFKDKMGCFLYIPPQGKPGPAVLEEVFSIMDNFNKNKDLSRIENVEERELPNYKALGYEVREKFSDYLCQRKELVQLKGNRFKSQRACLNYFIKHYEFEYLTFNLKYKDDCFTLYNNWARQRRLKHKNLVYQWMLKDSQLCLGVLLEDYSDLDIVGRIVKVDGKIKAFSFGFRLNPETFCILYEITDLSIKGLSQFIFWQFCRELKDYKYINIMDDSGLENLKQTKLSYQPVRLIPNYIIKRNGGHSCERIKGCPYEL